MHQVYMLLLQNGRIYVGSTEDLDRRYHAHNRHDHDCLADTT